jgi:hypothetical protein
VPLSIVVLQALDSGPRAERILDRLQLEVRPAAPQSFSADTVVRLPCKLLPDEARADIEHRLQTIDADWRNYILIRESRPKGPPLTRQRHAHRRFTDR